jgi:hypothetical protein
MRTAMAFCAGSLLAGTLFITSIGGQDATPKTTDHIEGMHHHAQSSDGHAGFMRGGMHHAVAKDVKLDVKVDEAAHLTTLRVGPIALPANTSHMKMPQPEDLFWVVPFDGWFLAYHPRLVDGHGSEVPGTVLHHVAFWNMNRPDFLCPNKEEHIFGAGGEMTDWQKVPGFGYQVQKGDKIRIETMVHNPTAVSYQDVYLQVSIPFQEPSASAGVKSYYPAWMDVESCKSSGYDLKPGETQEVGSVTLHFSGVLLGVGGHMHDYGKQLVLEDVTRNEVVATLEAKTNEGQLLGMPAKMFFEQGGYALATDDELRITATYNNPTGKVLHDGAMGIVVGYFVPANGAALAGLRREEPALPARDPGTPPNQ